MSQISFEDLADRLVPETLDLFREIAATHLESTGDRFFILTSTFGGTNLHFRGKGSARQFSEVDKGALADLTDWGLLRVDYGARGSPNYRITGEGQRFYQDLMQGKGSAIEQIEEETRRVISGAEYAEAHPKAAHHLREAFELLWSGQRGDPVVSELGDHLRKALMDATTDLVGPDAEVGQERPIERLMRHLERLDLPSRETEVVSRIVELTEAVLRLDQRLDHIRDEADKGKPSASWEEIRRAAFTTAFTCYELDRLQVTER